MNEWVVPQLVELFKSSYGIHLGSAEELLRTEMNLLEMLVRLGRQTMGRLFEQAGTGHQGAEAEKEGVRYRFEGHREKVLHGLFGGLCYRRAYYVSDEGSKTWFPLDERLGIQKKHTPACQYFLSSFTAREGYQESLDHFHEIFRPDGAELISMRKALDMDYELGERLEQKRQQEIEEQFEEGPPLATEREIEGTMVVSIDAGKVRLKGRQWVDDDGRRRYQTEFRDAKIAAISALGWNEKDEQAFCEEHSYVSGIEPADEFFRRIWVEMNRRTSDLAMMLLVFIGDGASWIWDRVRELANDSSVCILDFYHAIEHLAELCKELFGEGSDESQKHYRKWEQMFLEDGVELVIEELKEIRDGPLRRAKGALIQRQINYFEQNKSRMRYRTYREMRLPIGSGTVESSCKSVIAKRLKQSGMTWTPAAAGGMLQMRCSLKSQRFKEDFRSVLPAGHGESGLPKAA